MYIGCCESFLSPFSLHHVFKCYMRKQSALNLHRLQMCHYMSRRTFKLLFDMINAKIRGYLYKDAYINIL